MSPQAIVAGHLCLDITPQFLNDRLPAPGLVTHVGPATICTGGAVSNTGLAMLKLGIDTRLYGRVGVDNMAQSVAAVLERNAPGSSRSIIAAAAEATSYTIILSPVGVDRSFLHFAGANDTFSSADVPDDALASASLLHLGYPPFLPLMYADHGRDLAALFRRAKQAGLTTSLDLCMLDPNRPDSRVDWRGLLESAFPFVDIFVPSVDELLLMHDPAAYHALARRGDVALQVSERQLNTLAEWALAAGAKVVMLKASTRGIYLRTAGAAVIASMGRAGPSDSAAWGSRALWAAPFVLDCMGTTTGAGDAAVAGFLAGLLRGCGPEQALTVACATGGCACETTEAASGVRTWDETLQRITGGWPRLWNEAPAARWVGGEQTGVWRGPQDSVAPA